MKFDEIGYWSEVKLEIVGKYAQAYSWILSKQSKPSLHHVYIDGFSGAGTHVSKTTGDEVAGSPMVALGIDPPFREYYLVDLDGEKVEYLRSQVGDRPEVHILEGNCNQVLLDQVFPHVQWGQYRRGLCLLDPYGLHLDWAVIEAAGKLRTIDLFLNFPVMDMNRNAIWRRPDRVAPEAVARMTAFWGDESWRKAAYQPAAQGNLFGLEELKKQPNGAIAQAFCDRLKSEGGFQEVASPMPMRNSRGAVVYYLVFASQKSVASGIVANIFDKYRNRGA